MYSELIHMKTSSSTSGDALLPAEGEYGHLDSPVDVYPWNMTIYMSVKCLFSSNFVLTNLHVFCVNFYYVQYIIIFLCSVYWYIFFSVFFLLKLDTLKITFSSSRVSLVVLGCGVKKSHLVTFSTSRVSHSCLWLWSKRESSCNFLYLKSLS